jgi:hypothetical protein
MRNSAAPRIYGGLIFFSSIKFSFFEFCDKKLDWDIFND